MVRNPSLTEAYEFKVRRQSVSLRHSVTESIRSAIALGHYGPGDRMPEKGLCELTGVSRTLIREALRQLESEGLVEVIPHRGPIVVQMTASEAKGVYEVRAVLESLAARLFAENATDKQLEDIERAFGAVCDAYDTGDVLRRLAAKNHFYECLVLGSGNAALGQALHMINARAMILRGRSLSQPERIAASLGELEAIIDALRERDAQKAERLTIHHVEMASLAAQSSFEVASGTA